MKPGNLNIFRVLAEGDVETASRMLAETPELVNEQNQFGQSVFWIACCLGYREFVKQALAEPVLSVLDISARDECLRSALDVARDFENVEIIEILNPFFGVNDFTEVKVAGQSGYLPLLQQLIDSLSWPRGGLALAMSLVFFAGVAALWAGFFCAPCA